MILNWMRWASLPAKAKLLSSACKRLEDCAEGQSPARLDVILLASAWGNLGYAAGYSYLSHVGERALRSRGSVLECDSGATTLLITALTRRTGVNFVVLEHNKIWYEYLRTVLDRLGYTHVRLIYAPIIDYGDFSWYQVPEEETIENVDLVICDGPPGNTPGGRFGLMPVMSSRLTQDCVILLDDTHRQAERRVIEFWRKFRSLEVSRLGRFGTFAEVICF